MLQERALESLKDAVTCTPIIYCFNVKEVVNSTETSRSLDSEQHSYRTEKLVTYAPRALITAETRYTLIEELLANVREVPGVYQWAGGIKVENDHKPVGSIFLKPLDASP